MKKDYKRTYINLKMKRNNTVTPKAPDYIMRNVMLTPSMIQHITTELAHDRIPTIDAALFVVQDSPDEVVVTLSVPHFSDKKPTPLEEFFQ